MPQNVEANSPSPSTNPICKTYRGRNIENTQSVKNGD